MRQRRRTPSRAGQPAVDLVLAGIVAPHAPAVRPDQVSIEVDQEDHDGDRPGPLLVTLGGPRTASRSAGDLQADPTSTEGVTFGRI